MVRLTRILAALLLLPSLALAQQRVGPLDARNNLGEIAKGGPSAQAAARTSLGLAPVAASGAYGDLTGKPALATVATSGAYGDLTGLPLLGALARLNLGAGLASDGTNLSANVVTVAGRTGNVTLSVPDIAGLGALAQLGVGAGLTSSGGNLSANVLSVAGRTGAVTLAAGDVSGLATVATSGRYADLSGLPAIPTDTSQIANGAGYVTAPGAASAAPVQSVAGRTGAVSLGVADVAGAAPSASPTFTGTVTGGTFTGGDVSAQTVLATGGSAAGKLADRASDELNLKRDFGAKGDGSTDDTAKVNAFLAVCATGHACFAPAGVYMHTGLILAPTAGETIRGAGAGSTIFRMIPGSTAAMLTYTALSGYGNQGRVAISDLTLDGNNHQGGDGIACSSGAGGYAEGPDLLRVTILSPGRDGLNIGTNCNAGTTDNVAVSHPGRNAMTLNSADWKHVHDLIYGADQAGYSITGTANNGSGLIRLTTAGAANVTTGQQVQVWGTSGSGGFAANGVWTVTAVDSTHVDLQGPTFTGSANSGGQFVPLYSVSGAANNGSGLIRITTATPHGFAVGAQVLLKNVGGVPNANGVWTVAAVPTSTTLDLAGSQFAGTYTSGGTIQPITVGLAVLAPAGNEFIGCNIYGNAIGVDLTTNSASTLSVISGSVDTNWIGGVLIQTSGIIANHTFNGTRFANNSNIGANLFSDFYESNTGGTVLIGTMHTAGTYKTKYIVETDGTLTSPLRISSVGYDPSGNSRTPYQTAATSDMTNVPIAASASPFSAGAGSNSAVMPDGNFASNVDGIAAGRNNTASGYIGGAFGQYANDYGINGWVYAGTQFAARGDGEIRPWNPLYAVTTDGTTTQTMTTGGTGSPSNTNALNLQNQSVSVFPTLYVAAKNRANATDVAVWKIDGLVAGRGASASATSILHAPTITAVVQTGALASLAAPTVGADTTHGGVAIQVVGIASTTLDWMASSSPMEFK